MRELSLKKVKIGEHIIIDEVEYVAQEGACDNCELKDDAICKFATVCPIGGKLTKVKKEPQYRPYKDTDEMISDWKERFMVDEIADFCMPMIWVKDKPAFVTVGTRLIVEIFEHVVRLGNSTVHLQNLFDNYTYLDGSPCGKVEE